MGYTETSGIVIKGINTGESDKVVTLFTASNGKIQVYARSSRRGKSNLAAACQFLCYSDFVLFQGRSALYDINSVNIIEPFYEIGCDLTKLTYAAHMSEIVSDIVQEEQPAPGALKLFLNTLHLLAKSDKNPELLARIFEFKILKISGFTPPPGVCAACASPSASASAREKSDEGGGGGGGAWLVPGDGSIVCSECRTMFPSARELSPGALQTLIHIDSAGLGSLFGFDVSEKVLAELDAVSRSFLQTYLEKTYKRLDILKKL